MPLDLDNINIVDPGAAVISLYCLIGFPYLSLLYGLRLLFLLENNST